MRFGDDNIEIGGREVGAVAIDVKCPRVYGDRYIGIARKYLGEMKRDMQFNDVMTMERSYNMKPLVFKIPLGELISIGGFEGQNITLNMPDASYLNLMVKVQVDPYIRVSSIRDSGA
jgi:hypothetical protein